MKLHKTFTCKKCGKRCVWKTRGKLRGWVCGCRKE